MKERGVKGFTAELLFSNIGIKKVFRKGGLPVRAHLEGGVYHLEIPFERHLSALIHKTGNVFQ